MIYSPFSFVAPKKLIYGWGKLEELGREAKKLGRNILMVCSKRISSENPIYLRVKEILTKENLEITLFNKVEGEPDLEIIKKGINLLKFENCDLVVGFGGGSAIDSAKAIAGIAMLEGTLDEYFLGKEVDKQGLPWIAIPTTAGTGAEATKNAVLSDKSKKSKQSIRSDYWMADLALVDPELTISMPQQVTAYTGMDAFTQAIEAYTSRGSTPLTDSISLEAAKLIGQNILTSYKNPASRESREAMALGSLMAGIALTNARLGLVHGLAHSLGVRYSIPHGLVCAILLPYALEFNFPLAAGKYGKVAEAIGLEVNGLSDYDGAKILLDFVRKINKEMLIPEKLSSLGLQSGDLRIIVEESLPSGSLKANLRQAQAVDLMDILEKNL